MRKKRAKEIIKRGSDPAKICTKGERKTYEIFLRGEHPDTRSTAEWLRAVKRKAKSMWFVNAQGRLQR